MSRIDLFMRSGLRLSHLRLILTLEELRSVTRAAAYLNVSQPAVSKTLSGLEAGLEVKLFHRTAQGMEPTEHGECLVRYARDIFGRMSNARDEMIDISEGRVSRISLGVLPLASVALIPRFIVRLEAEAAAVTVSVREGAMADLLPDVRAGELDLLVGIVPDNLGPELSSEMLYEDHVVAAVRQAHPLTARRQIDWRMLADYPVVLPPEGSFTRGAIDAHLLAHGVDIARLRVESVSVATNTGVLQLSDSIGFFSSEVARYYAAHGMLAVLPLNTRNLAIRVGLTWMTGRRKNATQQLVHRLFRETRDSMLPDMEAFARKGRH